MPVSNLQDLKFNLPNGKPYPLADLKGKAVLIVNTATKCGLTPQFGGLELLHNKYKDEGLVVLGFPCNQFGGQEPLTNEAMIETCEINHGVTFQLLEKIEVNGGNAHPAFKWLKSKTGGFFGSRIKWNFTKFLIAPDGKTIKRYASVTKPEKIEADIKKSLPK
jgi:glutathione peroxidase